MAALGFFANTLHIYRPSLKYASSLNLFQIFDIYSELTGLNRTNQLTATTQAQTERARINQIMTQAGFNRTDTGSLYRDLRNVSDLRRFAKPRHVETYIVGNANQWDVCIPFFANYTPNQRKPLFESAQLLGVTAAAIQLDQNRYAQEEIASALIPTEHVLNPGSGALLTNNYRTAGDYETTNGTLSTFYTPVGRDGSPATVEVETRGEINFSETYEFNPYEVPTYT